VLTGIRIDAAIVPIQTSSAKAVTEGTGKQTAGRVARGAAVGGLVNGSKGAKSGAKVGTGASILTRGNSIYVPAGTLMEYRLAAPLSL